MAVRCLNSHSRFIYFGNYFFGRQANRANVKSVTNILWKFGSLLDQSDPIQETDYNAMITIHRQSALSTLLISMSRAFLELGLWQYLHLGCWPGTIYCHI